MGSVNTSTGVVVTARETARYVADETEGAASGHGGVSG